MVESSDTLDVPLAPPSPLDIAGSAFIYFTRFYDSDINFDTAVASPEGTYRMTIGEPGRAALYRMMVRKGRYGVDEIAQVELPHDPEEMSQEELEEILQELNGVHSKILRETQRERAETLLEEYNKLLRKLGFNVSFDPAK